MRTVNRLPTISCDACTPETPGPVHCEKHDCVKPAHWIRLCHSDARARQLWDRGGWAGQIVPADPAGDIPGDPVVETIEAGRFHILDRRRKWARPDFTFEQCLGIAHARPWPDIERSLTYCARQCTDFDTDRCVRYGSSCQDRTRWLERIIRIRCKREETATMQCHSTATRFITVDDLRADTMRLIGRLPPTITRVVGIARSGIIPASILATMLHVPLWSTSPRGLVDLGTTYRLRVPESHQEHVLVVDDTAFSGKAIDRYGDQAAKRWPGAKITRCVIYAAPKATGGLDLWAVRLPKPHYLQWHMFNSPLATAAMDFDGILCDDCPPEDDDDGPRYLRFLAEARPKYYVRFQAIPLIATARLHRPDYRRLTIEWLRRHGTRCRHLEMGPWASQAERARPRAVEAFKARVFKQSKLPVFIESDPGQARRIAAMSRKPVICPAARLVFRP